MELARLVFMSTANVWLGFLVEFITVARGNDEGDILYVSILHALTYN